MRHFQSMLALAAFVLAAALSYLGALWGVSVVEARSAEVVHERLSQAGLDWVHVSPDGLLLHLTGTAPTEATRLRAISVASSQVDPSRVLDNMSVTPPKQITAPRFSVELLRNESGISLIGLVPDSTGHDPILKKVDPLAGKGKVTDMLETADYPAPRHWSEALDFGLAALAKLPRSKISIAADRVSITAISDSIDAKRQLEAELAQMAPSDLKVALSISAPRPVITPFTLRFVSDETGARFDACSADTDAARSQIIAAAIAAGAKGKIHCTVGLGVPSPQWGKAVVDGIRAVQALGRASITFSDADVTLLGDSSVSQTKFDRVAGDLEAKLPDVFSLKATLAKKKTDQGKGPVEFVATLSPDGQVEMHGRLGSALTRTAVTSYARAAFPDQGVYNATRIDKEVPDGWPVRVLAGLQALSYLHRGALLVRPDTVNVTGISGDQDASDEVSRVLSDKLGQGQAFKVSVKYDKKLDPNAGLPSPQECVDTVNGILKKHQITFDPGSDKIDGAASSVMDQVADALRNCTRVPILIAGYTDNQGRAEMNLALSQKRAQAVLNGLLARRVSIANFRAKGFGEADPIADNSTQAGREENRRIEFSLIASSKPATAAPGTDGAQGPKTAPSKDTPGGATSSGVDKAAPAGPGKTAAPSQDGSADQNAAGAPSGEKSAPTANGEAAIRPKLRPKK
ncbi:membrane protein [Defluviimonas sp. 20V17]|uniref:Membrane protein n=1 Tax=Allgaiera indica TaxID=765699 RepID=A0AAN4USQ1_9RHOB|nr:OmpA family protein [Allgaiera indica]KDB05545.1 membrane protein [Defluviimonas sp. 20V17]GHE03573.1 membrane protein [Allgaiera indica]SDX44266.1 OmpA-OmpF porin, OOP family [Allgaiera indica]